MITSHRDNEVFDLEFLEVMTIRACNLSCQGCTTFSDLTHSGYITWDTGKAWLEPWINRFNIQAIGFMGGEPLINPEISQWIRGVRQLLPQTQIRFVTNGFLLHRHWHIVDLLDEIGNCVLKISYHLQHQVLDSIIDRIMTTRNWQRITEFGIDRWISDSGLRFQVTRSKKFFKTFQGPYSDMKPHDNEPDQAFKLCVQKKCPLLYNGRIWKCGTLALTPDILQRMGSPNLHSWQPYIQPGLQPDCDSSDLANFVKNFGQPHAACRQCPTANDMHSIQDHATTVSFKSPKAFWTTNLC